MHKDYTIPKIKPYKTISVGPNKDSFKADYRDDVGSNITTKNSTYCELTAQYWVWKNMALEFENIGLCHYRRYFANSNFQRNMLLKDKQVTKYLKKYDIILPEPWYWNMTVAEKYYKAGEGQKKDLETAKEAIEKYYPEYLPSFNKVLSQKYASYCNMLVTSQKNFDDYNEWLFKILEYVEDNTDISSYTTAEKRIFGYLSEILLNVWVSYKRLNVKYLPMIEKEASLKSLAKHGIEAFIKRAI